MPNYCYNRLEVKSGNRAELEGLMENACEIDNGTQLSFEKLFPCPAQESNWYDWRIDNWGVKWPVEASLSFFDDYSAVYEFDSAWNPPKKFIVNISKKFPRLMFVLNYEESAHDLLGKLVVKAGKIISDHS